MKRYYIVPVITESDPDLGTVRRLKLPLGMTHGAAISNSFNWGLAVITSTNFTALDNDSTLTKLPEITMDATLNTIPSAQRTAIVNRLTALGVNVTGITASTTFRQMLQVVGRHLDPNFNTSSFDVSE